MNYFELHTHSHFSFGDGVSSPKDIAVQAKKLGYPFVAITDHGELAGWYEFYKSCQEVEVQPLFGIEFYVAYSLNDTEDNPFKEGQKRTRRGHLLVLAKGKAGIDAIRELYNNSWNEFKEKGKKQIIFETDLVKYAGNIVVASACVGSYIDSEEKVERFKQVFGNDFYLEIQPHIIDHEFDNKAEDFVLSEDKQLAHNNKIYDWAKKHNIPMIITGDSHYSLRSDKILQDIIILSNQYNQSGWHFYQDTHFMMNEQNWKEEITKQKFSHIEEVYNEGIKNLYEIAEKCKGIELSQSPKLRKYDVTSHLLYQNGDTSDKLIMRIIKDIGRYNKDIKYIERLKYELKIIKDKNFFDYFLIVEDIVRWNKKNNYLVGPARGSAAGSLLSYYMDITKIDPIKYDLLFERFLDVDRGDYPDIDVDYEMKEETVAYISQKYGAEFVMAIGAYQTMKIKTALKTAYRILYKDKDYDYQTVNIVSKELPDSNSRGEGDQWEIFKGLLDESEQEFKELQEDGKMWPKHSLYAFMMNKDDLKDAIHKLLGKVTNMRVHPCSIVISDSPVAQVLPVTLTAPSTSDEKWVTSFDGPAVEASGLVKFDILGLKTLNCISACLEEIKKYKSNILENGIDISNHNNIWQIEPNDPEIFEKMAEGDTDTVFTFNTHPLKKLLREMQASNFNDLVASAALIRPGPAKAGFPKLYCDRKFNKLKLHEIYVDVENKGEVRKVSTDAPYSHPLMDEILKDTYNVTCIAEGSKVVTDKGPINIEEVSIGTLVLTEDGTYQRVLNKINNGIKDVFKIKTQKGEDLLCTGDHKVLTSIGWKETKDLTPNDLIKDYFINSSFVIQENNDIDWLIGNALADGCLDSSITITCSSREKAEKISDIAKSVFPILTPNIYFNTRAWYVALTQESAGRQGGNPLLNIFKSKDLMWKNSHTKRLPKNISLSLLAGFIEGDGNTVTSQIRLCNKELAYDIFLALNKFEIPSKFYQATDGAWTVLYSDKDRVLPFKIKHHQGLGITNYVPRQYLKDLRINLFSPKQQFGQDAQHLYRNTSFLSEDIYKKHVSQCSLHKNWSKVIEVIKNYDQRVVWDLTVEKNHSFVVGGHIVHNCYQEQVQKIFIKIGGFTPVESNKIRKAISKGKKQLLLDSKSQFVEYATKKLVPAWTIEQVDKFYEDMIGFGSYCFNLSHSVSYALLGYVCQYLKTKYPLEWWSGNLKHAGEKGTSTILKTIQKGKIVPLKSVDINESKKEFYFNGTEIVMPIKYIEGIGESGLEHIIKGQPFTSFEDFVTRMPGRSVRKNSVTNLIVADAFRNIDKRSRGELLKIYYIDLKKEKTMPAEIQVLIDDKMAMEKERCKADPFYNSNWAENFKGLFDSRIVPINKLKEFAEGSKVYIGGEVESVKYLKIKKGQNKGHEMAWVTVKQSNASVKVTLWPDMLAKYGTFLNEIGNGLIEVKGKITHYNQEVNLEAFSLKEVRIG